MVILIIITAFVGVLGCKPQPQSPTPLTAGEVFTAASERIVEIKCGNEVGSGFIISAADGYATAVTCYHLVDGEAEESVRAYGGEWIDEVEFVAYDNRFDTAFLRFACDKTLTVLDANARAKTGETVYAVGNALGEGVCIVDGIVSVSEEVATIEARKFPVVRVTAPFNPGMSGGIVLNEFGGTLGMAVGRREQFNGSMVNGVSYALPYSVIYALYSKASSVGTDKKIRYADIEFTSDGATLNGVSLTVANGAVCAEGVTRINGVELSKITSLSELACVVIAQEQAVLA